MIRPFSVVAVTAMVCLGSVRAEDDTKMATEMKVVSKQLKALRTIPKDDYAAGAEAVRKAHEALLAAMQYIPVMVEEMPDGEEKAKAIADSRRVMGLSYASLCALELAYLEKDPAKIEAAMSKVKEVKKEGHKKYTDD
ncbi:hypothetical protein ACFSW8_10965 [Rubritalea tangerina]|uniref:HEAT repeat domain-containing protein n=2 Tax=Rubritalea tangerina TaxID=430798 RepID=A0ABW4ZC35_9BACT